MKKRNNHIFKRVLASVMALTMCTGMLSTTAFASAPVIKDYVYVFIDVDQTVINDAADEESNKPTFTPSDEQLAEKDRLDAAKAKETSLKEREGALNSTLNDLDAERQELVAEKNAMDASVANAKTEADKAKEALDDAEKAVNSALNSLLNTDKPEYSEPAESEPVESEPTESEPTESEPTESEPAVTDPKEAVTKLNQAQAATTEKVESAHAEALEKLDEVNKGLEGAENTIKAQREAADKALKVANTTLNAYESKQEELQKQLDDAKAELSDPGKAPVRGEDQDYEEYLAEHNAWVEACNAYNAKITELERAYTNAAKTLNNAYKKAQKAATAAENAITKADETLATLQNQAKKGELTPEASQALAAYNLAVGAYNDNVEGYNTAADEYNEAVTAYNKVAEETSYTDKVNAYGNAVNTYNGQVDAYNGKVDTYNGKVGTYEDDVSSYETDANAYNDKVDEFNRKAQNYNDTVADPHNSKANEWNNAKIQAALKTVVAADIQAYCDIINSIDVNDQITNDKIVEYNAAVEQYNAIIEGYNSRALEYTNTKMDSLFGEAKNWNGHYWWTIGRIDVEGAGFYDPLEEEEVGDKANRKNHLEYNGPLPEYFTKDYLESGVYTIWDKESGTWTTYGKITTAGTTATEDALFGNDYVLNEKFYPKHVQNADPVLAEVLRPEANVYRWVLKINGSAYGYDDEYRAAGYNPDDPSSIHVWHLDGSMSVQKLNTLATLALRAETYEKVDPAGSAERINDRAEKEKETNDYSEVKEFVNATKYKKYADVTVPGLEVNEWKHDKPTTPGKPKLDYTKPDDIEPGDPDPNPNPTPNPNPDPNPDPEPPTPPTPPTEDVPEVEIPNEDVPLDELPEDEIEVDDPDVPLDEMPEEEIEIDDPEVPLADVPQTGDISSVWYAMTIASACGLAALKIFNKEDKEEA